MSQVEDLYCTLRSIQQAVDRIIMLDIDNAGLQEELSYIIYELKNKI